MKYIKRFNTEEECKKYVIDVDLTPPNILAIKDTVHFAIKAKTTFYIQDYQDGSIQEYKAQYGMTWRQWIQSEFNTIGLSLGPHDELLTHKYLLDAEPNETIIDSIIYTTKVNPYI